MSYGGEIWTVGYGLKEKLLSTEELKKKSKTLNVENNKIKSGSDKSGENETEHPKMLWACRVQGR